MRLWVGIGLMCITYQSQMVNLQSSDFRFAAIIELILLRKFTVNSDSRADETWWRREISRFHWFSQAEPWFEAKVCCLPCLEAMLCAILTDYKLLSDSCRNSRQLLFGCMRTKKYSYTNEKRYHDIFIRSLLSLLCSDSPKFWCNWLIVDSKLSFREHVISSCFNPLQLWRIKRSVHSMHYHNCILVNDKDSSEF